MELSGISKEAVAEVTAKIKNEENSSGTAVSQEN
jgi:hypothetical protein